jgi:hypothetical protein
MLRAAIAFVVLCRFCIGAPENAVLASAQRIEKLAAQESPQARVDTRLRTAQLLGSVAPDLSKRFLADALAELPAVVPTRGIVMSLMAVQPDRGEAILVGARTSTRPTTY